MSYPANNAQHRIPFSTLPQNYSKTAGTKTGPQPTKAVIENFVTNGAQDLPKDLLQRQADTFTAIVNDYVDMSNLLAALLNKDKDAISINDVMYTIQREMSHTDENKCINFTLTPNSVELGQPIEMTRVNIDTFVDHVDHFLSEYLGYYDDKKLDCPPINEVREEVASYKNVGVGVSVGFLYIFGNTVTAASHWGRAKTFFWCLLFDRKALRTAVSLSDREIRIKAVRSVLTNKVQENYLQQCGAEFEGNQFTFTEINPGNGKRRYLELRQGPKLAFSNHLATFDCNLDDLYSAAKTQLNEDISAKFKADTAAGRFTSLEAIKIMEDTILEIDIKQKVAEWVIVQYAAKFVDTKSERNAHEKLLIEIALEIIEQPAPGKLQAKSSSPNQSANAPEKRIYARIDKPQTTKKKQVRLNPKKNKLTSLGPKIKSKIKFAWQQYQGRREIVRFMKERRAKHTVDIDHAEIS